ETPAKDCHTKPLPPAPSPKRRGGADTAFLPLSASGRGRGGGVLSASSKDRLDDFREVLEQADLHPDRRTFLLRSIVVNNLYGVDIMDEAVEMCKLRLWLELVTPVERPEDLQPLPDLGCNLRAGNSLVGLT